MNQRNPDNTMIRVLIADGHRLVAEAMRLLVESQPDMVAAGCVREGRETLEQVRLQRPDVVLMEYRLAEMNGIDTAAAIHRHAPATRVLMVAMETSAQHIARALEAGAAGYVPKDAGALDLLHAIRVVHAGHRYVHASLASDLLSLLMHPLGAQEDPSCLSSRELQVLQMTVEGRTNGQIAGALYLSPKTVSTYRTRIMEKLHLRDLPSVVRFAMQHGIGPAPLRAAA